MTSDTPVWNPLTDWHETTVNWVKVRITKEDLQRFTQRSNLKGLCHSIGFLAVISLTGTGSYLAFIGHHWILLAITMYLHGTFYKHFGDALHEIGHNTVFSSKWLTTLTLWIYGWLYWPWNPYLYRLSHLGYHHRYTLYQGSDGEDTPNYVELKPKMIYLLFLKVLDIRGLINNLGRLISLKPTSNRWRGRGYPLDTWEQFILQHASEKQRKEVYRFAAFALISHTLFVALCVATGYWFIPILITLAPFYGAEFHGFLCSTHQHAACEANHPDFRVSCGDARLDTFSSFLYWHMEYHIEHHMFASIPCYNLKAFSRFVADQLPQKENAIVRLFKLNNVCRDKYGSWQIWRDKFGFYKGF